MAYARRKLELGAATTALGVGLGLVGLAACPPDQYCLDQAAEAAQTSLLNGGSVTSSSTDEAPPVILGSTGSTGRAFSTGFSSAFG